MIGEITLAEITLYIILFKFQFIAEMLSKLLVTFLDDSHEHVDATCIVSTESEETLYDTIGKSGVQVRK